MNLPGLVKAVVTRDKIADYLLSDTHPVGRHKARWFLGFGFSPSRWERLAEAMKRHAAANAVTKVEDSRFGTRYIIEGELETPDGRNPAIRAVWFVDTGQDVPRLVTAHPLPRKRA
ncbi:MAG: hypothetical protein BIFFINMI_03070 [Phycisphaerae bacterium]|nr:hypothetical protein [Phycisphaerae bacterium]